MYENTTRNVRRGAGTGQKVRNDYNRCIQSFAECLDGRQSKWTVLLFHVIEATHSRNMTNHSAAPLLKQLDKGYPSTIGRRDL